MPGNGGVRAVKRRKKPVQKIVKLPPVKTNPSKRHRDRLNVELDHLTHLLPLAEEVRGRLDKLSVLRLSVGYLKAKSYFHAALQNRSAPADSVGGQSVSLDGVGFSEGDLLLQALNGFVLVVTADGTVFYTSPTVLDFLGFHQSDVVHQSLYELVHLDDREMFRCQLYFSFNPSEEESKAASRQNRALLPQYIPPENSSFLERSFCCRLRCLLDNTSGFLALNFNGRLKYLHLENAGADGTPPQLALFAIATPVQPPSVMKIRTKTLIFQTKHSMDFAPLGVDTRGKLVLGYSEIELVTPGSGYQFIHAADMMYCADNHLRMMKTGDSGFTFFRLLTKTREWLWVQASARVVFKGGRPDFIIARQRALTNEEGEEHFQRRRQQLPFNVTTGEGVLYDTWMDAFSNPDPPGSGVPDSTEPTTLNALDPTSLLGSLRRQELSLYSHPQKAFPELPAFPDADVEDLDWEQPQSSLERAFLASRALLSVPSQNQTSPKAPVTVELTSDAVFESLEQILGDIGRGGMEDIAVEEQELREWEKTLVRMNSQRQESSRELNRILATDVFSYVEEALRREFGGFVQDHPQGQHEQLVTDRNSGYLGQALRGNGSGGPKAPRFPDPHQANSCRLWHQHQPCDVSTPCRQNATQRSWLFHGQSGSDVTDRTQYCQRQPEPWSAPERRQLPQSFHRHPLTHSSHPQSPPPRLQTLRLPGSCMYEKREGHILNEANLPVRQNGPVSGSRGPVHVAGATSNSPFTLSHPDPVVGAMQASAPRLSSRTESGPGASYHPEHGPFFCCNKEAQISRVSLNGVVDPLAFSALHTGTMSQNPGS